MDIGIYLFATGILGLVWWIYQIRKEITSINKKIDVVRTECWQNEYENVHRIIHLENISGICRNKLEQDNYETKEH
jgi:cell division protein FtsL